MKIVYNLKNRKLSGRKIKEQGFRFQGDVGVWKEWDETGKIIKETDNGHTEKLDQLREIKYYR